MAFSRIQFAVGGVFAVDDQFVQPVLVELFLGQGVGRLRPCDKSRLPNCGRLSCIKAVTVAKSATQINKDGRIINRFKWLHS